MNKQIKETSNEIISYGESKRLNNKSQIGDWIDISVEFLMKELNEIKKFCYKDGKVTGRYVALKEILDWIGERGFRDCNFEMNTTIKHLKELMEK